MSIFLPTDCLRQHRLSVTFLKILQPLPIIQSQSHFHAFVTATPHFQIPRSVSVRVQPEKQNQQELHTKGFIPYMIVGAG